MDYKSRGLRHVSLNELKKKDFKLVQKSCFLSLSLGATGISYSETIGKSKSSSTEG